MLKTLCAGVCVVCRCRVCVWVWVWVSVGVGVGVGVWARVWVRVCGVCVWEL